MKQNKLSVKAIICLAWLLIGVAAVFVGILLKVPDADTQFRTFMITSDASLTQALFQSSGYTAMMVLKYILIAAGVIVAAIASIGFAGAMETAKLEELMFDEDDYCDFDCAACDADCEDREDTAEETAEEAVEEITEEAAEEKTEE